MIGELIPTPTQAQLDEAAALVATLTATRDATRARVTRLERELKAAKDELYAIERNDTGRYSYGSLPEALRNLERLRSQYRDSTLPRVADYATCVRNETPDPNLVITRITAKMLFYRTVGYDRESQLPHDGKTARSRWPTWTIDVEAAKRALAAARKRE